MVKPEDYYDGDRVRQRCDVDPAFIGNWEDCLIKRPYVYVPELKAVIQGMGRVDYGRLVIYGGDLIEDMVAKKGAAGLLKVESITPEQIRIATGQEVSDSNHLKPVRLDKALSVIYAVNRELERKGQPLVSPKIILSAFGLKGLKAGFNAVDATKRADLRGELAKHIEQSDQFASEFLKGNAVSIDVAIRAHGFLRTHTAFERVLAEKAVDAIETPSQKHRPAARGEDFSRGRVQPLPSPLERPT